MVEFTDNGLVIRYEVPGAADIRIPWARWLVLVEQAQNQRQLQELILRYAGYQPAAKAAAGR